MWAIGYPVSRPPDPLAQAPGHRGGWAKRRMTAFGIDRFYPNCNLVEFLRRGMAPGLWIREFESCLAAEGAGPQSRERPAQQP